MIERQGETSFDYELHGGRHPIHMQWYFLEQSGLPVAVQSWELPPGGSEGMHAHPEEAPLEELYIVIEGSAVMRVDEEEYALGPGDAVLAPVGSRHDLENTGDGPLRLIVVWGEPGATDWSRFGSAQAARDAAARRRRS